MHTHPVETDHYFTFTKAPSLKKLFLNHGHHVFTLAAVWSFFAGCGLFFDSFGKPNGLEEKYPLFLLTITLVALYAVPLIALSRYLAVRFAVSRSVINLSWLMGVTSAFYFSEIGHTVVGAFWLFLIKPSEAFLIDWGAAVSAPFAEEFGKGLTVLLILLVTRKFDLKHGLLSGMVVGLAFQIIEDCFFTFQEMFVAKSDGFTTLLERIVHAGGTHWVFSLLVAVGLVALLGKNTGMSRAQGAFWIFAGVLAHFLVNSPFNEGITSKTSAVTVAILSFNLCLALAAFRAVNTIERRDTAAVAKQRDTAADTKQRDTAAQAQHSVSPTAADQRGAPAGEEL